jgi:hypothetical protein
MYVKNPEVLKNSVVVTRDMSLYLEGKGFLLIGKENQDYYFSKTPELEQAIKNTPIWLKLKQWLK